MPNTTELRSWALPAKEMFLVAQNLIFRMIFSTKTLHSNLLNLLVVTRTPKYLMGREPTWKLVASRHCYCRAGLHPPKTIWDFSWFAWRPAQLKKANRVRLMIDRVSGWALQKFTTSSANIRRFSLNVLHDGWKANCGLLPVTFISLVKYSIARTNNRGERGSPCLRPLPPLKATPIWPFTWIL